ncbi:MAG: ribosome maturation factor RimM [Deltaproteobacteria bacterium]
MSRNKLVVIGQAVKPFGIRGEIKIKPYTESFEAFKRSPVLVFDETPYTVLKIRIHKGAALASLQGIDSPEKAKELAGSLVKTNAENLPPKQEDEYYWHELIGMSVYTLEGRSLGELTQIIETGAHDVLQVEGAYGEILLPMIDEVVVEVDIETNKMIVDPLDGLVPDD